MRVKVTRKDHYWILTCEGDTIGLQPGPIPEVRKALAEGAHDIILEFGNLYFLGTTGIKSLQETVAFIKQHGAHLGISAPQRQVRRILKLSGLARDIPIYFNLNEAITKLDMLDYQPEAMEEAADTLVVVQNELQMAEALRNVFSSHPLNPRYHVKPVRSLKEAFDILRKEKVDCVIIESTFPVFQVANFIENVQTDEKIPTIPMLVVTKDDRLEQAEIMIRHGVHELLRYPFIPGEVVIRLQALISQIKDHRPYYPPESVTQPRGYKA